MKKYLTFLKIRFLNGLQYRAAALAGIVTQFVWGYMELKMFSAFYKTNPEVFPMEFSQLSSYVWLQQALLAIFMIWFLEGEIFEEIRSGNIAYELCRPLDLYNLWFTRNISTRLSKVVLRCLPILLIAFILPEPFRMSLPTSFENFILFLISTVLGFFVVIAFCMLIYIATFFTLSPTGIRILAISLVDFLSGSLIPLPFLPKNLRFFLELLPFAAMQNVPLRIYSGHIVGTEIFHTIFLQVFWVIILVLAGKLFMKKALEKVVVQGG